jgi:hypothetical protein
MLTSVHTLSHTAHDSTCKFVRTLSAFSCYSVKVVSQVTVSSERDACFWPSALPAAAAAAAAVLLVALLSTAAIAAAAAVASGH